MAFVDRKKQAHLWRTSNPYPTPEQVVMGALAQHAAGMAVDFSERVIAKAFKRFGVSPPTSEAPTPTPPPPPKAPRIRAPRKTVSKTKGVAK